LDGHRVPLFRHCSFLLQRVGLITLQAAYSTKLRVGGRSWPPLPRRCPQATGGAVSG
jgi:hypothetical protein